MVLKLMKKISIPKISRLAKKKELDAPSRITNETVAEHREQIIAGGRRFKYPVQYARHKLVFNAVIIVLISLIVLILIGVQQLYVAQNSSSFMYRITQIVPVPVATVANEPVRYSDYLMQYRGLEHYLSKYDEIKMDSADGKAQLDHYRRQSLNKAIAEAYAAKIARSKNITVFDKDVDAIIQQQLNTANGRISQETYDASSMMIYGWDKDEYRQAFSRSLLRAKVAFAVDDAARAKANAIGEQVKAGKSFDEIAAAETDKGDTRATAGTSTLVSTSSTFNGLNVSDIAKLQKDTPSEALQSATGDGYFFVKVIEKTDTQVNFQYIHIPLTVFSAQLADLKKSGQVHEFIKIPEA
jgi:hypothetical protein